MNPVATRNGTGEHSGGPKSNAERSRAYHERTKLLRTELEAFVAALEKACQLGLTNRLPDDPTACLRELTARLADKRLIVCQLEKAASDEAPNPARDSD